MSRIGLIFRLTHVNHSGVGPNPRHKRVVACYRRQRKVGSMVGIEDWGQPLHVEVHHCVYIFEPKLGLDRDSSPRQRRFDGWAALIEFGGETKKLLTGVELWIEASKRVDRLVLLSQDTRVLMTRLLELTCSLDQLVGLAVRVPLADSFPQPLDKERNE